MSDEILGECYFLDVGQGTGIVVYLGDGRVIIIDGGPSSSSRVPLTLLDDLGVRSIEFLVVSHNDRDHCGGACEILWAHREKVRRLCFLVDRPLNEIKIHQAVKRVDSDRASRGRAPLQLYWLGRNPPRKTFILFQDQRNGVRLEILYPSFKANLGAQEAEKPNATSGVLRLRCGSRSIIFPGDATIEAWKEIHRLMRNRPIFCDILAVPHHGGLIWTGRGEERARRELKWLYGEAVRCRHAVISVGTGNDEGHPRREVVRALRESFDRADEKPIVLCTQITSRCCADPARHRPGIVPPHAASLSAIDPAAGRATACAGTVRAEFGPEKVVIEQIGSHQDAVERLVTSGDRPLCRP